MPSLIVRILLFISSYSPLLVIAFFQWHQKLGRISYVFLAAATLSLIVLWMFFRYARRLAAVSVTIDSSRTMNAEALNYVATYVFPFLDSRPDDPTYAIGLAILYVMLAVIYINSNMIHINPILNMCGFRLLEVETAGSVCSLITRKRFIAKGSSISVRRLGDDVLMEV
jgi:hypothetical protein